MFNVDTLSDILLWNSTLYLSCIHITECFTESCIDDRIEIVEEWPRLSWMVVIQPRAMIIEYQNYEFRQFSMENLSGKNQTKTSQCLKCWFHQQYDYWLYKLRGKGCLREGLHYCFIYCILSTVTARVSTDDISSKLAILETWQCNSRLVLELSHPHIWYSLHLTTSSKTLIFHHWSTLSSMSNCIDD